LIGLGLISLLVSKPDLAHSAVSPVTPSLLLSLGLFKQDRFRAIAVAGGVLSLATASDGFIYLLLQKSAKSSATVFPLFAFLTALGYVIFSIPAGTLADRWSRRRVFLTGYAILVVIYSSLLWPGLGRGALLAILALFGAYYAATDGVLAAMASAVLTPELRTS